MREHTDELSVRLIERAKAPVTAHDSYVRLDFDTFTMDNSGTQATTGLPKAWGEVPKAGYACWIAKKGGTC